MKPKPLIETSSLLHSLELLNIAHNDKDVDDFTLCIYDEMFLNQTIENTLGNIEITLENLGLVLFCRIEQNGILLLDIVPITVLNNMYNHKVA